MSKPLIAIGADVASDGTRDRAFNYMTYVNAVVDAGGVPLIVPPQEMKENLSSVIDSVDGVLLAGGFDCDPSEYGEEQHPTCELMDPRRQQNDLELARLARSRRVPTLGICLGMQVMNVAAGGTLIQDIRSENASCLDHESEPANRNRHEVNIAGGTRLAELIGSGTKNVNSSHHQAVRRAGEGLRVTASAPDGVIEALEDPALPFYVAVQWHPEDMRGEDVASTLFAAFVAAARAHAERKRSALV